MLTMHCHYEGDLNEATDAAVTDIVEQFQGAMADSGYGCGERDLSAEFDHVDPAQRREISRRLSDLGCLSVTWQRI